jgi:hypothetical protein
LPVLTKVDGLMIPLEELDDSTKGLDVARGRFSCEDFRYLL